MKQMSKTAIVTLAVLMAVFSGGVMPTAAAAALEELSPALAEVTPEPVQTEIQSQTETEVLPVQPEQTLPVPSAPTFAPLGSQDDIEVTPVEPTWNDACGSSGDTYTIPTVQGVNYYRGIVKLTPGQTYSTHGDSSVLIWTRAASGYTLKSGAPSRWTHDFSLKCTVCHRTASASNPYVQITVDQDSVDGDGANDNGKGDHYLEHTGPVFPARGDDGKWGDIIPPIPGVHDGRNWTAAGQAIYDNNCNVPITLDVTPGPCVTDDETGNLTIDVTGTAKDARLVVKDANDQVVASWQVQVNNDGEVTSPTFPVTADDLPAGDYTIQLLSKNGNTVLASTTATVDECEPTPVAPAAPTQDDTCYRDNDWYFIPITEGVEYLANGDVIENGWHDATDTTITITAQATEGYVIETGATSEWTLTYTDKQCVTISKSPQMYVDANGNGLVDNGDYVKWDVTLTNTSDEALSDEFLDDHFYVEIFDEGATLSQTSIDNLAPGASVTLHATKPLSASEIQACKASNTAMFYAWRNNYEVTAVEYDGVEPVATGQASAILLMVCGHVLGDTTVKTPAAPQVLPAEIPATGGETNYLIFGIVLSALTYFVVLRRQEA